MFEHGFCPFRVKVKAERAGCVLQMGAESLCYSEDSFPLINQVEYYFCPMIQIKIGLETYENIELLINSVLNIQDEQNTYFNLWSLISGMSNPKIKAETENGREIQHNCKKILYDLRDIIADILW